MQRLLSPKPFLQELSRKKNLPFFAVRDLSVRESSGRLADLAQDREFFLRWLAKGFHGKMAFLERNVEVRSNPDLVLDNARSALIFLVPYAHNETKTGLKKFIARYAWVKDYHETLKKELEAFAKEMGNAVGADLKYRVVIDSVPFLERAHARLSGLGFVGHNSLLIRPGVGSFHFIATLLTNLPPEIFADDHEGKAAGENFAQIACGSCDRCVSACPTSAIVEPRVLDASQCIAYLSIEHRGPVEDKFVSFFGETLFGCDICQDVCPYNKPLLRRDAAGFRFSGLKEVVGYDEITPEKVANMTQVEYERWFGGTSLTRAKYEGLVRNALYFLHANKSPQLASFLDAREQDASPAIRDVVCQLKKLRKRDQ